MKYPYHFKLLLSLFLVFAGSMSFAQVPNSLTPTMPHQKMNPHSQWDAPHGKLDLVPNQTNNLSTKGTLSKTTSVSAVPGKKTPTSLPTFLDSTFGTNGSVRNAIRSGDYDDRICSVAIQSDGKIVAAGYSWDATGHYAFAIARYNADGTTDSTFGTNGSVRNAISGGGNDDEAYSVVIQSDGKIVAAGYSEDASRLYAFAIARYNSDGTLDNTFGTNGSVRNFISGSNSFADEAYSVAIQSDGKIVAAGSSMDASGNFAFAIARYNSDGTLDTTFGTNGSARNFISGGARKSDGARSVAIQSDGKIVSAGYSYDAPMGVANAPAFAIARYNTNGTPDITFGTSGSVRTTISGGNGTSDRANSVAIQSDGKIVAAGYSAGVSAPYAFAIARYNTNGTLDNTFGTNGSLRTTISGSYIDQANSVVIQSDGKIVAAGSSRDNPGYVAFAIARYNTNGTLDNTFGTNGSLRNFINGGGNDDEANSVAIQSDGKIVAAGYSYDSLGNYPAFAIARYLGENSDVSLSVQATDFASKSDIGSVTLSWKTGSEVDNAGFNVLRTLNSEQGTLNYELVASYTGNDALKGMGTSSSGRSYSFTDSKVKSGASYEYKIQSVTTGGVAKDLTTLQAIVGLPKEYALYQNYPNPFNPATMINYQLPVNSLVTLKVYDVLGREVSTLVNGQQDAGVHKVVFDGARFASGVYYCRIMAQDNDGQRFVSVKKLVLMK